MKRSNNIYWSLGLGILWLGIGISTIAIREIPPVGGLTALAAGITAGAFLERAFSLLRMAKEGY